VQPQDPIAVVRAWQQAANDQEIDRLIALSAPEIELVGPRGAARGHTALRDWLGRAGLHLTTLRTFARGPVVVAAQRGVWRSAEAGEVVGEAQIASRFRVADGQVVQFARHDSLDAALAEAGLGDEDEARTG
jgi:hypothetical protein